MGLRLSLKCEALTVALLSYSMTMALGACGERTIPPPRFSGDPVPNFTLREFTSSGELSRSHTLADYRGEIVVLNFWATWCLPCVDKFPAIAELAEKYEADRVRFLGIIWDETKGKAQDYLAEHGSPAFVQLWDDQGVGDAYRILGLPAAFVIDREGRLALALIGAAHRMDEMIRQEVDSLLAL